eukprot:jgi/Orpsp1_1/1188211/evm.model.d7180000063235.1
MGNNDNDNSIDNDNFEIKLWNKEIINRKSGLWFIQLLTMLKKNFILQFRYWKTSLLISVITPLLAMLLLELIILINGNEVGVGKGIYHPTTYPLAGIEDCIGPVEQQNSCINVMFTNCIDDAECQRDPSVDEILTNFIESNNKRMKLNWETDSNKWEEWNNDKLNYEVKEKHDIVHVPNSSFIYNYSLKHQNITHFGIVFDIVKNTNIINYRYQLWFNSSMNYNVSDIFGTRVASISRGIDEAI